MRLFGYIRVSGDEQADRGLPVAGQREGIQRYADAGGHEVVRWFVDEARPGSSDRRDAFQAMMRLAHAEPRPTDGIVIWSWSRFSRDQDDAHFWKASLRRQGVQILAVEDAIPQGTGMDYVFEALIHWKDEQRLGEIGHDARRGQQTLARLGYIPSGCRPPRGYRVAFETAEIEGRRRNLRRWVVDPVMGPIARRAWELRLAGASYATIIRETGLYKSVGCLATFFSNTAYRGVVTFGGTRIEIEPIVTPGEWDAVNANRQQRRYGRYARRKGSAYLLSGLLRCARCGGALAGGCSSTAVRNDGYARAPWPYYRCLATRQDACDLPRLSARELESAVLEYVYDRLLDADTLAEHMAALAATADAERPAIEAQLESARGQRGIIQRQIDNLVTVIENTGNASLVDRLQQRESELASVDAQIAELSARLTADVSLPDVDAIREQLRTAVETDTPAARELLKALILDITVDVDTLTIRGKLPGF